MPDDPTPFPRRLKVALEALADALPAHQADYALIGGLATGLRSRLRLTDDIDLLLKMPQLRLPGLLEDLLGRGFSFDLMAVLREWTQHHLTVLNYGDVRIDWLKPVLPAYQHVLDSAVVEHWHGRELRMATAEGLILLKLIASRSQDVVDIESLLTANPGRLDLTWVEQEWLTLFPADDPRWQRFRQLVAEFYARHSGQP